MIIDYLHVMRSIRFPTETDPPLVVDANAVLSFSSAFQGLEAISGWYAQFAQYHGGIQDFQFPLHDGQQVSGKTPGTDTFKYLPSLVRPEALDHAL